MDKQNSKKVTALVTIGALTYVVFSLLAGTFLMQLFG